MDHAFQVSFFRLHDIGLSVGQPKVLHGGNGGSPGLHRSLNSVKTVNGYWLVSSPL